MPGENFYIDPSEVPKDAPVDVLGLAKGHGDGMGEAVLDLNRSRMEKVGQSWGEGLYDSLG